jgi:uncharacterized protein YyaL (SSP411 family)
LPAHAPSTASATRAHANRLAGETSPYLLQHAHNPVDWYPWGPEAFDAARKANKPIFLSVGYSTCYWCHVMERECFENESVAAEMNQRFISIKVDREERPDVDQLYMLAVQVLTHHGGWPMSVFLTPDLRPFYGGTYFPPEDSQGRAGFKTILRAISDAYHNRHDDVEKSATQLVDILSQISEPSPADAPIRIDEAFIDLLAGGSVTDYDSVNGGFGPAPKFPRETLLELLLIYCSSLEADARSDPQNPKGRILKSVLHTLDAMRRGGIHDHLGGGFHRYSTDEKWLVPHFEIMLYDNAMLAWCYVEAYRQTKEARYAQTAREILDFILREMTSPQGAFYTAFDAEVDAMEGATYLWTAQEIRQILGDGDAKMFNRIYGLDRGPNFADPHHGTGAPDRNVLFLTQDIPDDQQEQVAAMRQKLLAARKKRKQPLLDTKIITSWNALAIRAFAYAGQILQEKRYIDAAAKAAGFLLSHHAPNGGLYRTSRDGATKNPGFLDDYAFLINSLLALAHATGSQKWKDQASSLAQIMLDKFGSGNGADAPAKGGFFFTEKNSPDLIVRQKTASDSPLPSGNAIAAMVMLELDRPQIARQTLSAFARQLRDQPDSMSSMVQAAMLYVKRHGPFTVEASPDAHRPLSPEQIAAGVVAMRATWTSPTQLNLQLNILKGFHINAHQAAKGLTATDLSVSGDDIPPIESIDYPPGEDQGFAFSNSPIRVYSGTLAIAVRFRSPIPAGAKLKASLKYQACDDNACFPPAVKHMELPPRQG